MRFPNHFFLHKVAHKDFRLRLSSPFTWNNDCFPCEYTGLHFWRSFLLFFGIFFLFLFGEKSDLSSPNITIFLINFAPTVCYSSWVGIANFSWHNNFSLYHFSVIICLKSSPKRKTILLLMIAFLTVLTDHHWNWKVTPVAFFFFFWIN